jgi:aminopeptidase-like protein
VTAAVEVAVRTDRVLGEEAYELMGRLFPMCRSLTGGDVRKTFAILQEHLPLTLTEVPSGTQVFDWTVPDEWTIRDAYVARADGTRVIDFQASNLHLVSYSEPVRATMSLEALRPRLHTLPDRPDLVPYRTSYHERTWGFCLSHRALLALDPGDYEVVVDSTLAPGHLVYAELELEGESDDEILISTYVCHPSLANDNLSGIAVAATVARELMCRRRRHGYRFLFAPGTLGPLAWLHRNHHRLEQVRHGLTISCAGDDGPFTYKRSRRGDADIDRAAEVVLRDLGTQHAVHEFEPWGGDERQFCAPAFDLPLGALSRSAHAADAVNHTSADNLARIRPQSLAESIRACLAIVDVLETNRTCINLSPHGEPQLGRRGLYRSAGGAVTRPADEQALLWVLNLSDGSRTLLDIAHRSRLAYAAVRHAADRLEDAGLVRAI